ncbi:hypothetical protein Cgig2_027693 [Carnegiea gigantea]|uniref:Uncharacterized protein n=1 Tax=Carnegiea gigantea TaxID=171969 RepID=A0A9Q1Q7F4_9CARY|nr:hypothetical protein Cgig2_027693 [Carnegiea gigantea]
MLVGWTCVRGGLIIRLLGISLVSSSPHSSFINTTSFSHIGYSSVHHSRGSGRESSIPIFLVSMAFPPIYNMREMADYMRGSFIWRWRSTSHPPDPLSEDFHILYPRFSLSEAEGAAADFELSEIVQATFYAMLLNEAVELGVVHDFTAESVKSSLIGLRRSTFEVWMDCVDHALRGA